MGERGTGPKSLVERVNGCRELGCRSVMCLCCVLVGSRFDGFVMIRSGLAWIDPMPVLGHPAFSFIDQGKARVTVEEKRRNEREWMAFRTVRSFLSFMRVPPTL